MGFRDRAPPPLFQCIAGAPLPALRDGADRRDLQPADATARRRDPDDRGWGGDRLRALLPVRHRLRARAVVDDPGGPRGVDAGGRFGGYGRAAAPPYLRRLACSLAALPY